MNRILGGRNDRSDAVPLFIVGCGRSGTTMLRLLLDTHSEIAIPGESHFIPSLWIKRRRYDQNGLDVRKMVEDVLATQHVRAWQVPEERVWDRVESLVAPTFSDVVTALFTAYADEHGKRCWGDKTPIYVLSMDLLGRLFPRAKFIHLIRDGRDVALSYLSVPWGPGTTWEAAWKWRRDVTAGRDAGSRLGRDRYLEIRYERLVSSPVSTLEQVCSFGGLTWSDEPMARPSLDSLQVRKAHSRYHARSLLPPEAGLRDWRHQMDPRKVAAFEAVAGDLLTDLGYERRFQAVPFPVRMQARPRTLALSALRTMGREKKSVVRAIRLWRGHRAIDTHEGSAASNP
jgi:hypothetical protein